MKIKKNQRVLLLGKRSYLVKAENKKFHTELGVFDLKKLLGKNFGSKIKTNINNEFYAIEPRTPDLLRKIKRMPQIITLKDAGIIASYTGLNKEDVVVEAGAGSGALTIFLAGIVKKVYAYEIRKDFYKIAKENLKKCCIKNVVLKLGDAEKKISEKDVDVVILDLGSPEKVIENARKALKAGGFLVIYSPVIEQVLRVYENLKGFANVETKEIIERKWEIGNNKTRPRTRMLGHTGFLTFARKV